MKHWLQYGRLDVSAMILAGCGDDDGDSGGGNGAGPSSEGAAITSDNVGEVQATLGTSLANTFAKVRAPTAAA